MGNLDTGMVVTGFVMILNLVSIVLMGLFYRYVIQLISKKDG